MTAFAGLLLGAATALASAPLHAGAADPPSTIELFTRAACPRCAAARAFLERLQREEPGLRVVVSAVDRDAQACARLEC